MDPASIVALVGAIIGAIYSAAPILAPLWRKIKAYYGRGCKTTGYLRGLGQQRITFDIQQMLMSDAGLRFAAQQHYLSGRPGKVVDANGGGGSSGDFSDLEDFDY